MKTLTVEQALDILKSMRYRTPVPDNRKALDMAMEAVENWHAVMEHIFDKTV